MLGMTRRVRELDDQAELASAEGRLDRAHDPDAAGDLHPLANLEWLLAVEVTGCDDRNGFRPGRSPHDALDALFVGITRGKVNWLRRARAPRLVRRARQQRSTKHLFLRRGAYRDRSDDLQLANAARPFVPVHSSGSVKRSACLSPEPGPNPNARIRLPRLPGRAQTAAPSGSRPPRLAVKSPVDPAPRQRLRGVRCVVLPADDLNEPRPGSAKLGHDRCEVQRNLSRRTLPTKFKLHLTPWHKSETEARRGLRWRRLRRLQPCNQMLDNFFGGVSSARREDPDVSIVPGGAYRGHFHPIDIKDERFVLFASDIETLGHGFQTELDFARHC